MSPYLIIGLAAGAFGLALGGSVTHTLDANHYGAQLATEKAAHVADLNAINAASAKQLADALQKQQLAEGKVAAIETQFTQEANAHAADSLKYRADLAAGTQRVRVHVASCSAGAAPSQSSAAAASADAAAAYADLDPATASSVFQVAADDQVEIDKLTALQAYVKTLQDQGYIGK